MSSTYAGLGRDMDHACAKTKDPGSSADSFRDSVTTRLGVFSLLVGNIKDFVKSATYIFNEDGEVSL